ncbi:hypothetical protein ABT297_02420 [Dactylosporangium sp. NPDC000555]|uniref:hypothetical protein n=1 Tax=Dactylosporangium sp. NPDC000555 TaxID=3154260 RepID=UPI003320A1C6
MESKRMVQIRLSQGGLIAHRQLAGAGVTRGRLRWMLTSGRWQRVLPRVYAMFTGGLDRRQRLLAAQLYGGDDALLTGAAALEVHGFRYVPRDAFVRVLVPRGRRLRPAGFARVHPTARPDRHARPNGVLRPSSAARAVVDAARFCADARRVRAMVAESVQAGHCTPDELVREVADARRGATPARRAAVEEVVAGVRSIAEGQARELLAGSTVLPAVAWNPRLTEPDGTRLPTPDGWIAEADLGVEVDSRAYHFSPDDWERTLRRHARLSEAGAVVLHFTPRQVRDDPRGVLAAVERAYLSRMRSGYRSRIKTS